ncbi:hypothetical protein DVH24_019272 [Malus domestica]|uniref:Transmembrane protein n=1 Tax=Malus domestica TaxID=3750 RepID=A0A498I2H7_MALDO|nr:hypothetical protein DVH24_019272 [Malus domestica]
MKVIWIWWLSLRSTFLVMNFGFGVLLVAGFDHLIIFSSVATLVDAGKAFVVATVIEFCVLGIRIRLSIFSICAYWVGLFIYLDFPICVGFLLHLDWLRV